MKSFRIPEKGLACIISGVELGTGGTLFLEFRQAKETVRSSLSGPEFVPVPFGRHVQVIRSNPVEPNNLVLTYCGMLTPSMPMGRWWSRDGMPPDALAPIFVMHDALPDHQWQEGPIHHWLMREAGEFWKPISDHTPLATFMMIDHTNWGKAAGILEEAREKLFAVETFSEVTEIYKLARTVLGSYPGQLDE
jgi:hypothetical protein